MTVEDPATAEPLGAAARATVVDMRPADRGRMLLEMARWIRDHTAAIEPLLTQDSGKTLQESGWEVEGCAGQEAPFGGVKKSGFGREKGQAALANYHHTKNVGIRRS